MIASKIDSDNRTYKRSLVREGRFWKGQKGDPTNPTDLPKNLLEYKRDLQTGDAKKDIFDYLESLGESFGPFKKALSIGCGSAVIERELLRRGIVKEFTFIDISAESLADLNSSLPKGTRRRVKVQQQDMNFIELQPNEYDLIFCANVLHHIINLEHVLLELNKSLSPQGIIVIDDFVGESRFQFSDARISKINELGEKAKRETGVDFSPLARTNRKVLINNCPFEAIRSDELHAIIKAIFGKHVVRETVYGAVSSWMNVVIDFSQDRPDVGAAAEIFIKEDKRSRLPPLFIFGVYRKNQRPKKMIVKRWSNKDIVHHLPVSVFNENIVLRMGDWLRSAVGNGIIYNTIKKAYFKLR